MSVLKFNKNLSRLLIYIAALFTIAFLFEVYAVCLNKGVVLRVYAKKNLKIIIKNY